MIYVIKKNKRLIRGRGMERGVYMTKELKDIILAKCDECERNGFDYLSDSDVMDILEECERRNISVTRKEIEQLGMK